MHNNSLEAYQELRGSLNDRQNKILAIIEKSPNITDREILAKYGGHEMNIVRPRITELVKKGLVAESGSKKCPITKRSVRVLKAIDFNHPNQMSLGL